MCCSPQNSSRRGRESPYFLAYPQHRGACQARAHYTRCVPHRRPEREQLHLDGIGEPIDVVRSARRRKTITARRRGGVFELLVPARLSARETRKWALDMYAKYGNRAEPAASSDEDLMALARALREKYLPSVPEPSSVRWVTNQGKRWGSCTSADGSIRLSHVLQGMPTYVIESVLVHELAHLLEPNHSRAFRTLEASYPEHERANGFLEGYVFAQRSAQGGN